MVAPVKALSTYLLRAQVQVSPLMINIVAGLRTKKGGRCSAHLTVLSASWPVNILYIYSRVQAGPEEFGKQSVSRNYTIDTQAVDTDPVQFYYSSEMVP